MVAAGVEPHRKRALALLALDQGVTQAEAGELSGLSRGRVRYWRDRFEQAGLGIFPAALLHGNGPPGPPKTGPRKRSKPKPVESRRGAGGGKTKKKGESKSAKRAGKGKKDKAGKGKKTGKKGKKSGKKRNTKKKKSKKQTRKAGKKTKYEREKGERRKHKKNETGEASKGRERVKDADIGRQESLNEEQDLDGDGGKELLDER
jgi:hypothetical protein